MNSLVTCSDVVRLWDASGVGASGGGGEGGVGLHLRKTVGVAAARTNCCCWNHNGQVVATAGDDGSITVLKLNGNIVPAGVRSAHQMPIRGISFSSKSRILAAGGDACVVEVWDLKRNNSRLTIRGHRSPVTCLSFFDRDSRVLAGDDGGRVLLHRLDDPTNEHPASLPLAGGHSSVTGLALSSTAGSGGSPTLAVSHVDGTVRVWDVGSKACVREIRGQHINGAAAGVVFHPHNPSLVATAGHDGFVRFVDIRVGHAGGAGGGVGTLKPIKTDVSLTCVSFHHEGLFLAAGASNGTVRLVDLRSAKETGRSRQAYAAPKVLMGGVRDVAFQRQAPRGVSSGASATSGTASASSGRVGGGAGRSESTGRARRNTTDGRVASGGKRSLAGTSAAASAASAASRHSLNGKDLGMPSGIPRGDSESTASRPRASTSISAAEIERGSNGNGVSSRPAVERQGMQRGRSTAAGEHDGPSRREGASRWENRSNGSSSIISGGSSNDNNNDDDNSSSNSPSGWRESKGRATSATGRSLEAADTTGKRISSSGVFTSGRSSSSPPPLSSVRQRSPRSEPRTGDRRDFARESSDWEPHEQQQQEQHHQHQQGRRRRDTYHGGSEGGEATGEGDNRPPPLPSDTDAARRSMPSSFASPRNGHGLVLPSFSPSRSASGSAMGPEQNRGDGDLRTPRASSSGTGRDARDHTSVVNQQQQQQQQQHEDPSVRDNGHGAVGGKDNNNGMGSAERGFEKTKRFASTSRATMEENSPKDGSSNGGGVGQRTPTASPVMTAVGVGNVGARDGEGARRGSASSPSSGTVRASTDGRFVSLDRTVLEQVLSSHVTALREELRQELRNLHVDMLRQFHSLQDEQATAMSGFEERLGGLVAENQALRAENDRLRRVY